MAVTLLLVVLGVLALRSPNGLPFIGYKTIYASVSDPGNLQPHSEVRIGGVRVGQVIGVRSAPGARALIELKLSPGSGHLPADTEVFVRAAGLLGARFVELRPGNSTADLRDGATIHGGAAALSFGVPDAMNTFDRETRGGLHAGLNGLGTGLSGQGRSLNEALQVAPQVGRDLPIVVDALLERPGAARRLIPSLAAAAEAVDAAREDLLRALPPTARGLQPLLDRRADFERTLDELPPTLDRVGPALAGGQKLLAAAGDLSRAAGAELPRAPEGLRAATALLRESTTPLRRAGVLLKATRPAVPAVLRITDAVSPLLAPSERLFESAGPIASSLGAHGCDIDNMTENWRSALGFGIPGEGQDTPLPNGMVGPLNIFRVTLLGGPESVHGFSRPSTPASEPYPAPCVGAAGPTYAEPDHGGGRR